MPVLRTTTAALAGCVFGLAAGAGVAGAYVTVEGSGTSSAAVVSRVEPVTILARDDVQRLVPHAAVPLHGTVLNPNPNPFPVKLPGIDVVVTGVSGPDGERVPASACDPATDVRVEGFAPRRPLEVPPATEAGAGERRWSGASITLLQEAAELSGGCLGVRFTVEYSAAG